MVLEKFTKREVDVIILLLNGIPPKKIGAKLGIAISSVNSHLANIKDKLGVNSITEAIICILKTRFLPENVFFSNNKVECKLTHREKEVLELVVKGKTSKEISDELNISIETVDTHRKNILRSIGRRSMNEIIILHIRNLLNISLPNDDEIEDALERPYNLTKRQFQILSKMVSGLSSVQIAKSLKLSTHSIESHKGRIFKKLGVSSSKEAILRAINENFYVLQIVREIEFNENHFKAGMSILSHFGTVLKQKNPQNTASVKIEQQGHKIRMIIDYKDSNEKEIIEKTLFDYGQVIIGNIDAHDFFPEIDQVIQFEAELQLASARYEFEKKRIHANKKIKKLSKKIMSQNQLIKVVTVQRDELRSVIGNFFSKSLQMQDVDNGATRIAPPYMNAIFSNNIFFEESEVKELIYMYQKADFNLLFNSFKSLLDDKSESNKDSEWLNSLIVDFTQIYAQYNSYKSKSLRGVLNIENEQILLNQVSDRVLQLINSLEIKNK